MLARAQDADPVEFGTVLAANEKVVAYVRLVTFSAVAPASLARTLATVPVSAVQLPQVLLLWQAVGPCAAGGVLARFSFKAPTLQKRIP